MALLTTEQQERIAAQIRSIETRTDAELVTVLASRSDGYGYISLLWAAALALLAPAVALLSPYWLETADIVLLQWGLFGVLALLFRIPTMLFMLTPQRVRFWRASNMARRQFLENNLHHTSGETGLLIFVSEAEHYVEIIADRGIDKFVEPGHWQAIVDQFVKAIKTGNTCEGFETCLRRCGEVLISKVPATHSRDELPNHLVVIGE